MSGEAEADVQTRPQSRSDQAIARGVAFLAADQQPGGGFWDRVLYEGKPHHDEATVLPAALVAHALSFAPEGAAVRERALDFLDAEMGPFGIWKFNARGDYRHPFFPHDVDDTSCASAALRDGGRAVPDNQALLLANRDPEGLFYTWFTLRPRWAGLRHLALVLPQLRHLRKIMALLTTPPCSVWNVDPSVNANALFYLGEAPETAAVADYLLAVIDADTEGTCDPWYHSASILHYFFARALAPWHAGAGERMRRKLDRHRPETPFETACHLSARACWGMEADDLLLERLLEAQLPSGAWPDAPWTGANGYWWHSEAIPTAFAVEALARARSARLTGFASPRGECDNARTERRASDGHV